MDEPLPERPPGVPWRVIQAIGGADVLLGLAALVWFGGPGVGVAAMFGWPWGLVRYISLGLAAGVLLTTGGLWLVLVGERKVDLAPSAGWMGVVAAILLSVEPVVGCVSMLGKEGYWWKLDRLRTGIAPELAIALIPLAVNGVAVVLVRAAHRREPKCDPPGV